MFTVRTTINVKVLIIIHFETIYQFYNKQGQEVWTSTLLAKTQGSYGVS